MPPQLEKNHVVPTAWQDEALARDPVFLPGESQGWESLVGSVYGVTWSRTRLKRLSSSTSWKSAFGTTHVANLEFPHETGLILRCAVKVMKPFQTKQRNRPSCGDQEGRSGSDDEDLREPLVRRQGSQVSMRVARGSVSHFSPPDRHRRVDSSALSGRVS